MGIIVRHGSPIKIAEKTGLSVSTVYNYIETNGSRCSNKTCRLIEPVIDKYIITKAENTPIDRKDIYIHFKIGDMLGIQKKLHLSKDFVHSVLHGTKMQNSLNAKKVLLEGERVARYNLWKYRFCKYKSLL